jgi:hypothetical protein
LVEDSPDIKKNSDEKIVKSKSSESIKW